MITHCATCGALVFQEQRGRPRRYCSDSCRYAMIAARRSPVEKPIACRQCGAPITQPHTGRPRQYCGRVRPLSCDRKPYKKRQQPCRTHRSSIMDLAIVAGRVSTKDQADKGYSLPEQVATGLAYVAERGYQLADVPGFSNAGTLPAQPGVFVEDFTGMSMDRPALDAVREVVKQHGVKVIIYTETDRLARKRIYGDLLELEFEELGARVEYAIERFDDSDEGKLFKDVKKALGEYERVKILRRMRTGKVGRAKAGKVLLGDCAPYGYRKSADGTTLVIDADEAKIVRRIFRAYIEGLSPYAIAGRLHADHVPTYAGPAHHMNRRSWSESMIRTVLANETYSGIWHHNKTRNEHKDGKRIKRSVRPRVEWIGVAVPAIIDAETFAQARARAAHNKANARRNRKHTYLFSGMLVCAACGRCYSGTTTRGKWRSYNCNGRLGRGRHGDRQCTAPYYSEADLDAAVWPWLTGILSEPEQALQRAWDQTWQRFAAEVAARSTAIDRLVRVDTQLADVRRRLVNLDDQLEVETDQESRSALRERKAQRVVLRRELEAERANLEAQVARQPPAPGDAQGLIAMCNAILHEAEPETPEKKRERYERVRMRARLEVKDGLKLAHVTCIVGEKTLEVGSYCERDILAYRDSRAAAATQAFADGVTMLDTMANQTDAAGYFADPRAIPALDSTAGYALRFSVQVVAEYHADSDKDGDGLGDRAGFSVIVLSSDAKGIELGFWEDQIWAQEQGAAEPPAGTLFTHAESARFDTTGRMIAYTLAVRGDQYELSSDGVAILRGRLRDYTAFEGPVNPYRTPNFIFLGDDTGSARAKIRLAYVAVTTNDE